MTNTVLSTHEITASRWHTLEKRKLKESASEPLTNSVVSIPNMLQDKVLPCLIGISLGMGLLVLLNQLQIPYYLYYPKATGTVLISVNYDLYVFLLSGLSVPFAVFFPARKFPITVKASVGVIWAVSLGLVILGQQFAVPILYATVIGAAAFKGRGRDVIDEPRRLAATDILLPALAIITLIESSCLVYFLVASINPIGGVGVMAEELELNLTFFLYPAALAIMLLLLTSWVWIPLIARLPGLRSHYVVRYKVSNTKPSIQIILASLDLFAITALFIFFYAYLAGQTWIVGVDSHLRYIDPLNQLVTQPPSQAFQTSVTHGVYVVFLYLIHATTGISSELIVKYMPLVLAFSSACVTFFAVLRGGWNLRLATLTSLSTLLWLPTTLGIWAGIQANWVAMLFWMIFLAIFFASREPHFISYVILAVLSLIILLVHPWTWGVFAVTLLLTTIMSRRTAWARHTFRALVASVLLALPIGIAAYTLSQNLRSDFDLTLQLYSSAPINPESLSNFGGALAELFNNWGGMIPPLVLLLCLIGALSLARRRGIIANYLIAWIATWCVGSILVAPSGYNPTNFGISETGLWRMLFVSPLPFLLALGLDKTISLSASPMTTMGTERLSPRIYSLLSIAPFIALGAALFPIWDPTLRLVIVTAALLIALTLVVVFPRNQTLHILVTTVLMLFLLNAALRGLFPLLLDPHNLSSTQPPPPPSGR